MIFLLVFSPCSTSQNSWTYHGFRPLILYLWLWTAARPKRFNHLHPFYNHLQEWDRLPRAQWLVLGSSTWIQCSRPLPDRTSTFSGKLMTYPLTVANYPLPPIHQKTKTHWSNIPKSRGTRLSIYGWSDSDLHRTKWTSVCPSGNGLGVQRSGPDSKSREMCLNSDGKRAGSI